MQPQTGTTLCKRFRYSCQVTLVAKNTEHENEPQTGVGIYHNFLWQLDDTPEENRKWYYAWKMGH